MTATSTVLRTALGSAAAALALMALPAGAATLDQVKAAGVLKCGVNGAVPGFSTPDAANAWTGIDVDYCRAVATAVFGDASKVQYVPVTAKERFSALQTGAIDVLSRNTTWTMSRDAGQGIDFVGVTYYDGQGIMVKKSLGVSAVKELDGASICVNQGTTTEQNLVDYFAGLNIKFTPVTFEKADEVAQAYAGGRCDAYTADRSQLAAQRIKMPAPDDHVVLPEVMSKEPLGPAVRQGDDQWADIARWSLQVMIDAEELGVTSANADEMKTSKNAEIRRLLTGEGDVTAGLGVDADFGYKIVKQVGNYGEIFERNLGMSTPLKLERGMNALYTKGGLQYGIPVR